jgi:uncharacterized membrane protein
MMPTWFQALRILHIVSGMVALFLAPAAMLTLKGGLAHRRWGKLYFWMMAVVAASAMVLSVYRPILFLGLVAVFSFYFAFRGYRRVLRKNLAPTMIDWAASLVMVAGSVGLIGVGAYPPTGQYLPAPAVSMVFGGVGLLISGMDIWRFVRPPEDENAWLFLHMSGMLASYIATVSAFSAVNFRFLPIVLRWLWPTLVGVPAIFVWIGVYRKKFEKEKEKAELVKN